MLIDASKELTAEDKSLINETDSKKRIIILNKSDLGQKITVEQMKKLTGSEVISTSILKELINKLFFAGIENSNDQVMVTNQRQTSLLHKAKSELEDVIQAVDDGIPVDIAQIDFTGAWDTLGEITGESAPDELITQLFSQFCLGK